MSQAEFHCNRPFDIDGDELDGLTPQTIFVLGYELCQVDSLIDSGKSFDKTVHAENRERIEAQLNRDSRIFELTWPSDDSSESWMYLKVCPK